MLRAVVFDFDGVIANSEPLHFRAFRETLAPAGVTLTESDYYSRYLGFSDGGAFEQISKDRALGWDAARVNGLVIRKAVMMEELEREQSVLFPGAAEAIHRLGGRWPLAIASGALRAEIVRVLEREGLAQAFRALVASEDTDASKPSPDPYRLAVTRLGSAIGAPLAPSECVAVEDSRWGLESARSAGLWTVGVTHTYPAESLAVAADAIVPSLDVLTIEFLGRIAQTMD